MGQPLRVGGRDERIPRTADRKKYDANFDEINWTRRNDGAPKAGKTQVVWKDGQRIVTVENGKVLRSDVRLTPNHLKSGLSVYDMLTHPAGPDSAPVVPGTTLGDISAAATAGGMPPPSSDAL